MCSEIRHRGIGKPFVSALVMGIGLLFLAVSVGPAQAASEEAATIPPGTVIDSHNWRNYKQFLTVGQIAEFTGTSNLKMPPSWSMKIVPTEKIPFPKAYNADTERYSSKVTLTQLPDGGFVPQNYVAGLPFPNPSGPNKAVQIIYDLYYQYKPWLIARPISGPSVNRFLNVSWGLSTQVITHFRHISDPKFPEHTLPGAPPDMFYAQYTEQVTPEESKYTAILALFPDDPSKDNQIYLFIPALRRSLRSSSASRCAPFQGSDLYYDDLNGGFNGIPSQFTYKLRKTPTEVIDSVDRTVENPSNDDFYTVNFFWPKATAGERWQMRPVYVMDAYPIESALPGYCYPRKTLYIDKEDYQMLYFDTYDKNLKFWKAGFWHYYKTPIPGAPGDYTFSTFLNADSAVVDFQNQHITGANLTGAKLDQDAPEKFHNIVRYATPAGLDEIMQ